MNDAAVPFDARADAGVGCVVPTDYATIAAAVSDSGCRTILVLAGTYTENLVISRTVDIIGSGAVVIDGGGAGRVIQTGAGAGPGTAEIRLVDLVIQNGSSDRGGGIFNGATLTLQDVIVRDNEARQTGPTRPLGGGIYNGGTLVLHRSVVESNRVTNEMNSPVSRGAGIYTAPSTTVTLGQSTVQANTIGLSGFIGAAEAHGAGIYADDADVTLTDSVVTMNVITVDAGTSGLTARARGAGIAAAGTSQVALNAGTRVTSNRAHARVGTSRLSSASGGGLHLFGGSLTGRRALITNNEAIAEGPTGNLEAAGGALMHQSEGRIELIESTVADNRAATGATSSPFDSASGGGLAIDVSGAVTVEVSRSTLARNEADGGLEALGGAFHARTLTIGQLEVVVHQSTVSGNTVRRGETTAAGGGLYLTVAGSTATYTVDINSSTISDNEVQDVSGVGGGLAAVGFTPRLRGLILYGNTAPSGPECVGTVESAGYNLFQTQAGCDVTGAATGDVVGDDPMLGPLTDNGGPTETHAIAAAAAAHEAGDPAGCLDHTGAAYTIDQRGMTRPAGRCDIGSYELQP